LVRFSTKDVASYGANRQAASGKRQAASGKRQLVCNIFNSDRSAVTVG